MHGEGTGDYLSTVSSVKPAGSLPPPPPPTPMACELIVRVARVVLPQIVSSASGSAKKAAPEAKTAPQTMQLNGVK